jgi:hypothetical protein
MKTKKILAATLLLCMAAAVSAQEEKPKTAIIKRATLEVSTYVDFVGGRVVTEGFVPDVSTASLTSGNTRYYHQRIITDSVSAIAIDMDAKTGVRYSYPAFGAIKHVDSLLEKGYHKVATEEVNGRIYDKYVLDDSVQYKKYVAQGLGKDSSSEEVLAQIKFPQVFNQRTIWLWHGVIVQTGGFDRDGKFVVTGNDILDFQVNVPLPEEKFVVPEDITIQVAAAASK